MTFLARTLWLLAVLVTLPREGTFFAFAVVPTAAPPRAAPSVVPACSALMRSLAAALAVKLSTLGLGTLDVFTALVVHFHRLFQECLVHHMGVPVWVTTWRVLLAAIR